MEQYDVIIIGGGAAGLMAATTAGQRGRRVLVMEHKSQLGAKILISGGGRCNFTNLDTVPERFLSDNKHFCKSALKRYTQHDFITLVEKHKIAYHEKKLGQLFCDGSAHAIVNMLQDECHAAGVTLKTGMHVGEITKPDHFHVAANGERYRAPSLILASGSLSIPKMGATGFSHDVAKQFGLAITAMRPALVPLTASAEDLPWMSSLSGVSSDCIVTCNNGRFRENILFTHRGLSGPAILQISSYWREGDTVTVDFLPDFDNEILASRKKDRPKADIKTILAEFLPQRLADCLLGFCGLSGPIGAIQDKPLRQTVERLKRWQIKPQGSEGYAKAEVTLGGVDTAELSSKTMEAKNVPGLYVIGEAVDVTGWLGGYNFQWAWSSGWCAGQAVS